MSSKIKDREELLHLSQIIDSFYDYSDDALTELHSYCREVISKTRKSDLELLDFRPDWVDRVAQCINVNQQILDDAVFHFAGDQFLSPESQKAEQRNLSRTRSTLKQIVREWSTEGRPERAALFHPIVEAFKRHLPVGLRVPRILIPGCGLGRLPFELARAGYSALGNEFSYHMLIMTNFILNSGLECEQQTVFPFATIRSNNLASSWMPIHGNSHPLRPIRFPDVAPMEALQSAGEISMAAGEIVEVFKNQPGAFDGIATCFFIDTAKNIMQYIRLFAELLPPGGIWVNCGPLQWHFAGESTTISLELSWTEVRKLISKYFTFLEEEDVKSGYAGNVGSMSRSVFQCAFFVCQRNDCVQSGESHAVYC